MKNDKTLSQQRESNSCAFLTSFAIREKLAQAVIPDENCDTGCKVELSRPNPFHPFLAEGQIRLLSQLDEIVYVFLLRKWDETSYLVVPFSSFADAATDLEYRLTHDLGGMLEVLQIWNSRTLQNETLGKTWMVARLNAQDCEAAKALWEYSVGGAVPSDEILSRTGVPICRKDDPRIVYQDRVMAAFASLDEEDLEIAQKETQSASTRTRRPIQWRRPNPFASRELFQREWRLAAADSAKPISATRKLEGFEGSLLIRYAPDDRELRIRAFDAAGERTDALDGWAVLGPDADVLGYFDGAVFTAKVPADFDGGIRILDIDGNPHDLIDEA